MITASSNQYFILSPRKYFVGIVCENFTYSYISSLFSTISKLFFIKLLLKLELLLNLEVKILITEKTLKVKSLSLR